MRYSTEHTHTHQYNKIFRKVYKIYTSVHAHTHIQQLFSIYIYKPPNVIPTPKARFESRDANYPPN
jgi:hypothetical protein